MAGAITCASGQLAIILLGEREAGDRSRDTDGFVSEKAGVLDDVALRVEVHVGGCGGGSFFAVVEEVHCAVGHADEHEASAAQVAGFREDDGQCKAGGNGRVDGVAAGFHHVDARLRGQFVRAHDHRMLGVVGPQSGRIGSRAEPEQAAGKSTACGGSACEWGAFGDSAKSDRETSRLAQRASDSQIRRVTPR